MPSSNLLFSSINVCAKKTKQKNKLTHNTHCSQRGELAHWTRLALWSRMDLTCLERLEKQNNILINSQSKRASPSPGSHSNLTLGCLRWDEVRRQFPYEHFRLLKQEGIFVGYRFSCMWFFNKWNRTIQNLW